MSSVSWAMSTWRSGGKCPRVRMLWVRWACRRGRARRARRWSWRPPRARHDLGRQLLGRAPVGAQHEVVARGVVVVDAVDLAVTARVRGLPRLDLPQPLGRVAALAPGDA